MFILTQIADIVLRQGKPFVIRLQGLVSQTFTLQTNISFDHNCEQEQTLIPLNSNIKKQLNKTIAGSSLSESQSRAMFNQQEAK